MDQEYQKLVAIIVDVLGVSESDPDVAATVTTVGQALELIKNAVEGA